MVRRLRNAPQRDRVFVLDRHFEVVACGQMKLLTYGHRQDDLPLLGKHSGHGRKILPRPGRSSKMHFRRGKARRGFLDSRPAAQWNCPGIVRDEWKMENGRGDACPCRAMLRQWKMADGKWKIKEEFLPLPRNAETMENGKCHFGRLKARRGKARRGFLPHAAQCNCPGIVRSQNLILRTRGMAATPFGVIVLMIVTRGCRSCLARPPATGYDAFGILEAMLRWSTRACP